MRKKTSRKWSSVLLALSMVLSAGFMPGIGAKAEDHTPEDDPGCFRYEEAQEQYEEKLRQEEALAQAQTIFEFSDEDPEAPAATAGDAELSGITLEDDPQNTELVNLAGLLGNGLTHNNPLYGKSTLRYGIDVSQWQGTIDWQAAKASGVEFAFIRVGYRGYGDTGSIGTDKTAITNLSQARAAGVKVGVYFFSQAITTDEAIVEAKFTLNMISGYALDLPVVFDYEYSGNPGRLRAANLTKREATDIMEAFGATISAAGYTPMIYASKSFLEDQLYDYEIAGMYPVWLAHYTTSTNYAGAYNFWQHTSVGTVGGISGGVDCNVWYDRGEKYNKGAYIAYGDSWTVTYQTHVAKAGWESVWKTNRQISGSLGLNRQIESLRVQSLGVPGLNVNYRAYQNGAWTPWVQNGADAGKTGVSQALTAVEMELSGTDAEKYDIYYCVYITGQGWLGWGKNGDTAGNTIFGLQIEALQVTILPKTEDAPPNLSGYNGPEYRYTLNYISHVQKDGWETGIRSNGAVSGTIDMDRRLEGIQITTNLPDELGIRYKTHIQTYGWEKDWKKNGEVSGTVGKAKRLEAIRIELTGDRAENYDVFYCVYCDSFGWLNWVKNGEMAGTSGYSYKMQAIRIMILPRGSAQPARPGKETAGSRENLLSYSTHVQTYGWQNPVGNGEMAGTEGQYKRLEGIYIALQNQPVSGSIEYRTHVQTYGWETGWKKNGEISGTTGKSKRLEAIEIRLTGEMAKKYDIYYQTHIQTFGWTGWAKNGEACGSEGHAKRLEGIRVTLVPKGAPAPTVTTASKFYKKK